MGFPAPDYIRPPFAHIVDEDPVDVEAWLAYYDAGRFDTATSTGYQIVSISLAGTPSLPTLTVVLALRKEAFKRQVLLLRRQSELLDTMCEYNAYDAALISAVGSGTTGPLFALVLERARFAEICPSIGVRKTLPFDIDLEGTALATKDPETGKETFTTPPYPDVNQGLTRNQYAATPEIAGTLLGRSYLARWDHERPRSVAMYETPKGYRYAAIWEQEPDNRVNWGLQVFPEKRGGYCPEIDGCVNGMTKAGFRPVAWALFPKHIFSYNTKTRGTPPKRDPDEPYDPVDYGRHPQRPTTGLPTPLPHQVTEWRDLAGFIQWEDSSVGGYKFGSSDRAWLDEAIATERASSRYPISIQVTGATKKDRYFAAVFAETDVAEAREFKVRHLPTRKPKPHGSPWHTDTGVDAPTGAEANALVDPFQAFDDFMKAALQSSGGRAGQLAIARDGRLVFARAYKWGESWYPLPDHTTLFRWASVSKTLTAIGIMRLVEQGKIDLAEDNVLASIAKLGIPVGIPTDPRLSSLKVTDALKHTGGLIRPLAGLPSDYDPQVPATNASHLQDILESERAIWLLKQGHHRYENDNYFLLGEVVGAGVAAPQGISPYEQTMIGAFKPTPLSITRARLIDVTEPQPTEALLHDRIPDVVASQLVEGVFDEQVFTGNHKVLGAAGGWLMAAADMARIMASFDWPEPPLLSAETFAEMRTVHDPAGKNPGVAYGSYRTIASGSMWLDSHNGLLPGAAAIQARLEPTARKLASPKPKKGGLGGFTPVDAGLNPLAVTSKWVIALCINSEIDEVPEGNSFGPTHIRNIWKEIRRVPEEAWPQLDQFPLVDPTWG